MERAGTVRVRERQNEEKKGERKGGGREEARNKLGEDIKTQK